ncbi:MAG: hypothetical protein ACRDD7_17335 [Peptostreptococcaceae bacterium]
MVNSNGEIQREAELDSKIAKAEKMLDEWVNETGVIVKDSSYYYEMHHLMVKCIMLGMEE